MPQLSARELVELRTTIAEVADWRLDDGGWSRVDAWLEALQAALAAADPDAVRVAWAEIEHLSPRAARTRLTRPAGPSRWSREQVDRLIDAIDLRLREPSGARGQEQGATSRRPVGRAGREEELHPGDRTDPHR